MGYVLRVRIASFFAGAAVASAMGIYALQQDYKTAHHAHSQQAISLYQSLEGRISALEKSQEVESAKSVEATP